MKIAAVELTGRGLTLEPFARAHYDGLAAIADDPNIWPYMGLDASGGGFDAWFAAAEAASASGGDVHFVARRNADGRLVGSSRYLNIFPEHKRLEIGNTWYAPDVWGSKVNPECKLLLLQHAFETLRLNRVEFRCDARNERSRAALHKLGAVEEGVLRRHMIVQHGYVRDSVQFGITRDDWPGVKAGLEARLAA